MSTLDRRSFIAATAAASVSPIVVRDARAEPKTTTLRAPNQPVAVGSANAINAVALAVDEINLGKRPVEGVVAGVGLVEADPNDTSVGYGGLPNEDGIVQLDSSVMDGPMHKAGAVGALEGIMHPAQVALKVLDHTDHVMLVGAGAKKFAHRFGFQDENLLTDRARQAWLRWRRNLNPNDDWLDEDQRLDKDPRQAMAEAAGVPFHYGTIHCSAVDTNGDLGGCTTTSGLSWKLPGRVGDSPIVGAGMFVDNAVGAAGSTGRGESVIQSCGAFQVVKNMENGMEPEAACLAVLKWIADHTKRPALLNDKGEPNFNVFMYAVRKDGAYGAACMRGGNPKYSVCEGGKARRERAAILFE